MAKPNKENIVTEMLLELKKGISYSQCLQVNASKWKLTEGTFVRYWKEANSRHQISELERQKQLDKQSAIDLKNLQEKHNITKDSLLIDLAKAKEIALIPNDYGTVQIGAFIKACEVQAKMLGFNEPEKVSYGGEIKVLNVNKP